MITIGLVMGSTLLSGGTKLGLDYFIRCKLSFIL
jgi:hypothetical protein